VKIGEDIKAVWVATVPRTGSMWTFNVLRDLVRATGRPVQPEIVPHADEEMEAIGQVGIADRSEAIYVLKVHTRIAADLARSCFVVTRRDLRDSIVSFMRFTKTDFDAGLRFLAGAVRLERHFATFPPERTIVIDYAEIIARPEAVITELGRRLSLDVSPALVAELVQRFSKDSVQARLVEREQALREKIGARQPVDVREFVHSGDRSLRAFDVTTGFQSGHVSAYREGDWRHILTPEQQQAVEALIAAERAK